MLTGGRQMHYSPDALQTDRGHGTEAGVTVSACFTCPLVETVRAASAVGAADVPGGARLPGLPSVSRPPGLRGAGMAGSRTPPPTKGISTPPPPDAAAPPLSLPLSPGAVRRAGLYSEKMEDQTLI